MIELNQWSNGDYYFKLFVVVVKKIERINCQRKRNVEFVFLHLTENRILQFHLHVKSYTNRYPLFIRET